MEILNDLKNSIIMGQAPRAKELTQQSLGQSIPPEKILNLGLIAGMDVVGKKFKENEYYVPEVLIAARAMKQSMEILRPQLISSGVKPIGKFVIGTVKGDLHDIGKNLVAIMLEGAGFEVIDLGTDVAPEKFIKAVTDNQAPGIGMSALLTTTMINMKSVIEALKQNNIRDQVKVAIGGAPVTQSYANEIGADAYAPDAASAVDVIKSMLLPA